MRREWERLEIGAGKEPYTLPATRRDHAGVILCLARQEHPDTNSYSDPEIAYRVHKYHHAGFVLIRTATNASSIFSIPMPFASKTISLAFQPVPDKPTA